MRVTNQSIFNAIQYHLSNITDKLSQANELVASGKRINKLSDDPLGLTQSLTIKSSLKNIEQLERNISLGRSWLEASESAISAAQDIASETRAIAVQMANTTQGQAERLAAAETVDNMIREVVSLGNSQVAGRYIFSGAKTDTIPFDTSGTYSGDTNPFSIKIGRDSNIEVGRDGSDTFGTIFTDLINLKTALQNNDVNGIKTATSALGSINDHLSSKIADIGSKALRLDTKEAILADLNVSSSERLSNIEDADITEAITDLNAKELAYQAALASASKLMQTSLMDYLK
jgi:flagellar hook-associated protein 3 FlgL